MNETITWLDANAEKPDADITVLLFNESASSPVWPGYWDGESWQYAEGGDASPTHWAEMPCGAVDLVA